VNWEMQLVCLAPPFDHTVLLSIPAHNPTLTLTQAPIAAAPPDKSRSDCVALGGFACCRWRCFIPQLDCTGCNVCVSACPEDALRMTDIESKLPAEVCVVCEVLMCQEMSL